jgi:proline utilization trans-activator
MSSSLIFGSHIMALSQNPQTDSNRLGVKVSKPPDNTYGLTIPRSQRAGPSYTQIWPTEEEAELLLNTVLTSIGSLQHLFDPRSVSDHLALDFTGHEPLDDPTNLWYVELLLVFAVGELLLGRLGDNASFPGEMYFMEAMNNMPVISHLNASGTQGIEIMGLLTFYLQCADRKDDAYIYVSLHYWSAVHSRLMVSRLA